MKTLDLKSLLIGVLLTMLIASFMLVITTDSAPRVWEYKGIVVRGDDELNKLGDQGWELVGLSRTADNNYNYVFKRGKQKQNPDWWRFWKWVGVDVDLSNFDKGMPILKRELLGLGAPAATVLEYTRDGKNVEEKIR
jgi:hypothetical protein